MPIKKGNINNLLISILGRIEKRRRFIIATSLATLLLLVSTFFSLEEAAFFLAILIIATYIMTFFAILEGISRHEWLLLFLPPVYFTVALSLFYFFLPQRWLTRLPFVVFYAISIYALMLSQNIFNVGVTKSLQLFRAASSVNFLYLTLSSFLSYSLIFSFRLDFALNFLFVILATFPLALHLLWAINPNDRLDPLVRRYAIVVSLIIAEEAMLFSFFPVNQAIFALLLTGTFYSISGLFQAYLQERLFKERIREYLFVLVFVLIIVFLTIR